MSASDNLSNELFFEAHRGLPTTRGDYSLKNAGQHWTSSKKIAEVFAKHTTDFDFKPSDGNILHANIPISSVETDTKALNKMDMYAPEREVPVKRGAKVLLTGVTSFRTNGKRRTRSYNPPREITA